MTKVSRALGTQTRDPSGTWCGAVLGSCGNHRGEEQIVDGGDGDHSLCTNGLQELTLIENHCDRFVKFVDVYLGLKGYTPFARAGMLIHRDMSRSDDVAVSLQHLIGKSALFSPKRGDNYIIKLYV